MTEDQARLLGFPGGCLFVSTIFCGLLVWNAWKLSQGQALDAIHGRATTALMGEIVHGLAWELGLTGSLVFSAVVLGGAAVWFVWLLRKIRAENAR